MREALPKWAAEVGHGLARGDAQHVDGQAHAHDPAGDQRPSVVPPGVRPADGASPARSAGSPDTLSIAVTETSASAPGQAAVRPAACACTVSRVTGNAPATTRLGLMAVART
jgi:hypothetical protein